MLWKCCTQYASKFGKFSRGHMTGKGQFSIQSQRRECQSMFKLPHNCTHLTHEQNNAKNSQARLQECEPRTSRCPNWFNKGRGTRDHIGNISWIIEKAREFQKNIYFCFNDYAKAFYCVDHNKLLKLLETGIPVHLTCLLRNLYTSQEATVRTRYGTMDWFQSGKGVCQGSILSPWLFNL